MLATLPDFLNEYWMYFAGVALVCVVASYFSKKFFMSLKRAAIVITVLFSLIAVYELITGKSIFELPADVDRKLSEEPQNPESGHRYYQSYEERFGEKVPKN